VPSANPLRWWRDFLALPNERPAKTVGVALLVALVCSLLVSVTAVLLEPIRNLNRLEDRASRMLGMLEFLGGRTPEARAVDLATGAYADRDPGTRTALPADADVAGLGSREDVAAVFEVRDDQGRLELVVLPVRGAGYQSTLEGYLALEADLNTVAALTFYSQNETPGVGARIEEDTWQSLWRGKKVADEDGAILIAVVKGGASGVHEVDGISGATKTGDGVTRLLRFWLGPDGYGPYLERLGEEARR